MRTLLIWECGQDLGHITHLSVIAKVLHDLGSDVFLCVKEEKNQPHVFKDIPYKLIPFPKLSAPVVHRPTFSMGDVLIRRGFGDTGLLSKQVKKWQAIYHSVQPDLVVYDFAPSALFSSIGFDFKKVIIDSTWGAPPSGHSFVPLNLWKAMPAGYIEETEKLLLESMNSVLVNTNLPVLTHASEIYQTDLVLISNFSDFDIYEPLRRNTHYLGPIASNVDGEDILLGQGRKRLFAYLKEDRRPTVLALEAIEKLIDVEAHLFIPNVSRKLQSSLEKKGLSVYAKPIALQRYIPKFDMVLCHGGSGTLGSSIKAGVPVVIFPTQLEQRNVAELVARRGAGLFIDAGESVTSATNKLSSVLEDERYRNNCLTIRNSISNSNSAKTKIRSLLQPLLA